MIIYGIRNCIDNTFKFISENERRIKANDREYNSQFRYAVSSQ